MEIIPAIDLRGGKCVRLRQGDYARETIFSDEPEEMAARWEDQGATRLHLVDLDGARDGQPANVESVRRIVERVDIACQLGGGIRDHATIKTMLEDVGVDRVIVGTQALKQPDWFQEAARRFPGKLILGLDARDSMVATEGWLDVSQTPAIKLASRYAGLPLAAIIYTNIAGDGMLQGVDTETLDDLIRLSALGLPVIASGGVTTMTDVEQLVALGKQYPQIVGAIVGRALYEGTLSLADAVQATRNG